ncbi:MAG TPA: hypothetical protein VK728_20050 [Candidatus Sulfotelmatobacter sp.]|jgi:hypothetical protein|nr:hypothetical protein [Candidatus Sulfotelmatobacter sp.]
MGHWIQAPREITVVQWQIALLVLAVIVAGASLGYYYASLPR